MVYLRKAKIVKTNDFAKESSRAQSHSMEFGNVKFVNIIVSQSVVVSDLLYAK